MSHNDFLWIEKFPETKYSSFNEITTKVQYTRCNPNIIQNASNDGFDVIVRTVNYKIENDHDYVIKTQNKIIHTENILVRYDKKWNVLSQENIIDKSDRPVYNVYITGLEDIRQCLIGDKKYVTVTCADSSVYGMPETAIFELKGCVLGDFKRVEPYYEQTRSKEKNWLPFEQDNKLFVIYKQYPTTIHEINPYYGNYKLHSKNFSSEFASSFRGSAGPIKFFPTNQKSETHCWLYVVHEAFYRTREGEDKWIYSSRWVLMSADYKIIAVSPKFGVLTHGIEFVSGLCYDYNDSQTSSSSRETDVIIGFSVRDSEAYRMKISISDIESVLEKC
jgi:hypothetical protein